MGPNEKRLSRSLVFATVAAVMVTVLTAVSGTSAQEAFPRGQNIAPVYEGWEKNPDGSFNLVFGYFNRNWEEEIDLPVGADNSLTPGVPDQGQPTRFYPRRNRFVFRVRVPMDFGKKELVWTLTSHGKTERAFATLKPDYFIDDIVIMNNLGAGGAAGGGNDVLGNKPPALRVESEKTRQVSVGQPVTLAAFANDDEKPKRVAMPPRLGGQRQGGGGGGTPSSATGLRVSWFVYRGAGKVTFSPAQIKVWEDHRDGANSPWAPGWATPPPPPDGKWVVQATFDKPGTYVLRCLASDGGLMASEDVTFIVN
jgi:hypothetical protein